MRDARRYVVESTARSAAGIQCRLGAIQYPRELPKFSEFEPFGRLTIPLAASPTSSAALEVLLPRALPRPRYPLASTRGCKHPQGRARVLCLSSCAPL